MRDLDARRAPLLQSYRWHTAQLHGGSLQHSDAAARRVGRLRHGRCVVTRNRLPRRYDGLASFVKFVCDRPYLGGWLLPQRRSYFVLKLAHDWCVERCCGGTRAVAKMPLYHRCNVRCSAQCQAHAPWHDGYGRGRAHVGMRTV
jgi:hypothetical protein